MTEEEKLRIKELPTSPYAKAIKVFLEDYVEQLKNMSNIDGSPEEMVVEIKSRKETINKVRNIIGLLGLVESKPRIIKNQYR